MFLFVARRKKTPNEAQKKPKPKKPRCINVHATSTVICGRCTTDVKMGFHTAFIWGTIRIDYIKLLQYCCIYV